MDDNNAFDFDIDMAECVEVEIPTEINCNVQAEIKVFMIWAFGPPGTDVSNMCFKVIQFYNFYWFSMNSIIEAEIGTQTARGKHIAKMLENHENLSNRLIVTLLKEQIDKKILLHLELLRDKELVFLIEGFPEERLQGILFEELIKPVDLIIYLDATPKYLYRQEVRRKHIYDLFEREKIKLKLQLFFGSNDHVRDYYKKKIQLIDATLNPQMLYEDTSVALDEFLSENGLTHLKF